MPARTASAVSMSPACRIRRASWTLLATLGVSVAVAVCGCSLNIAAMSWSTSSSRLRRGLTTLSIVRLPATTVAVVITTSFCVVLPLLPCRSRPLAGKEEGPSRMGDGPLRWDGYEGAGRPRRQRRRTLPTGTPGHEPPKQQRSDAQPDEVQEEELHVEGQQRRRNDQSDRPGRHDPLALPPGPLLRGLDRRVAHRLVGRPNGQPG